MRVTAFFSLKGGVAKTTSVINTAAILAKDHRKRVLIIDGDPQCNTSEFFHSGVFLGTENEVDTVFPDSEGSPMLSAIITGADSLNPAHTDIPGIDTILADPSLMDIDLSTVKTCETDAAKLGELLPKVARMYDYVLIDCPPAFTAATAAALMAADDVVIPVKLDAFSISGMANLMRQVKNMQRINPRLRVAGVLPTMWYRSDTIRQSEHELRGSGLPVFSHIRRSPSVDTMTYLQQPLVTSSPGSGACIDYRRFTAEFVKGEK